MAAAARAIERLALRGTTPVEWRHSLAGADRFSYAARWSAENLGTGCELAAGRKEIWPRREAPAWANPLWRAWVTGGLGGAGSRSRARAST